MTMNEEEVSLAVHLLANAGLHVVGAHWCEEDNSLIIRVRRPEIRDSGTAPTRGAVPTE